MKKDVFACRCNAGNPGELRDEDVQNLRLPVPAPTTYTAPGANILQGVADVSAIRGWHRGPGAAPGGASGAERRDTR